MIDGMMKGVVVETVCQCKDEGVDIYIRKEGRRKERDTRVGGRMRRGGRGGGRGEEKRRRGGEEKLTSGSLCLSTRQLHRHHTIQRRQRANTKHFNFSFPQPHSSTSTLRDC